jgi:glycosyltransferase involved in cell wall biosynthesis
MNILMHTTYYHPHVSGLTIFFKRLAEYYHTLGHAVTLIAAQHDKTLPLRETCNGVNLVRVPYLFKINKGLFAPRTLLSALGPVQTADIVHLNLPSLEALCIALLAKLLGKKVVSTYACDLHLPPFRGRRVLTALVDISHILTLRLSDAIASCTADFASHSRVLAQFKTAVVAIYPPIEIPEFAQPVDKLTSLRAAGPGPLLGMATRFASDKGIEYCLGALPALKTRFPGLKLVIAGDMHAVGEERYRASLAPLLERHRSDICCLGLLNQNQLSHFYRTIDLLVVSSINSTEAFGMVQIEAMAHGTPVVATDLPGVTVPIQVTGMGEIARRADSDDLARKIITVITDINSYRGNMDEVRKIFSVEQAAQRYLELYNRARHA